MNVSKINRASGGMRAWKVCRPQGKPMALPFLNHRIRTDTVFFDADMDAETVRRCLIDHDGYPADLIVREENPSG